MKDIEGFEGIYAVTKNGRVWSYPNLRERKSALGKKFNTSYKGQWRRTRIDYEGYPDIVLKKAGKILTRKLHRLVAIAYIPNPLKLREINHKNGIKTDNRMQNLEWCTRKQNAAHAKKKGYYAQREIRRKNARKSSSQI